MASGKERADKLIRQAVVDSLKGTTGATEELTEAQKKAIIENKKYIQGLIEAADALKLENSALKQSTETTEKDVKAKMIALGIQQRIKQQTADNISLHQRKQTMDALGLKLMTQIKKEDQSALIAKQQIREEEAQRLISQQAALDLAKQEAEATKKATIAKHKAKFIEEQRKILIKEDINLRKQASVTRAKELADLKKAIIDRHSQVSILHRLLGIKRKLHKVDLLNVRNQRNLGGSLSVIRSKLLIASFGFGLLTRSVNGLIGEYAKYQATQSRVNSALISTGFASKQSVQGLSQLASEIQNTTGVSDTLTLSSSALLTTFTQIGGETFPIAQKAIVDMTAAMNAGVVTQEGLKSSTIQVGKALNDPIKGLTSLSRVGVAFTQQQKDQIKTLVNSGKATKAQAIILKELNKEFGDIASADSYEKSLRQLDSAFGDLQKEIGVTLLPVLESLVGWLAEFTKNLDTKDLYEFIVALGTATVSIMTMRKWMIVMNAEMAIGVTRIGAISKALRTLASSTGAGIAIVALGFLIERSLEFLGVFDDVGDEVDDVTNKFLHFKDVSDAIAKHMTAATALDELRASLKTLIPEIVTGIDFQEKWRQGAGLWGNMAHIMAEQTITLSDGFKITAFTLDEVITKAKAHRDSLLVEVKVQENLVKETQNYIDNLEKIKESNVSDEVDKITKKYKNQLEVLNATGSVNKELVKVSQDLFDGNQDLIAALDDETHKYHDLAIAIEEVVIKKKEQANQERIVQEAMQFTGETISFISELASATMQADVEAMKKTSEFKLAQKRGDDVKMEKLEKDAMAKTLQRRQNLFLASQLLAAADVVIQYQIAIARGFGEGGPIFGIPLAALMQTQMLASLGLIAAQTVAGMPKFAQGGNFETAGPQMIMVGDNPGGRERVQVTPLSSPNIAGPQGGGGSITVNVSGNVLSQDFVEGELAENIKEAIRRGTDFGIS